MKKTYIKVLVFILFTLSLSSSCKEIRDLLKAIDKYGYKSKTPLGKKETPIDKLIIGSYVFKSMPIIISEKDNYTYILKFLSTELDVKDIEIEAFITEIGTSKYLNLDLGYSYSFLKISDVSITRDVSVKLLKNTLNPYINEKNLKSWLLKHDGEDEFVTQDSTTLDIFYTFSFLKITEERAYKIKAEQLQEKKEYLFSSCTDYETYKTLSAKYTGDPALAKAREAILNKCTTIDDYKTFVSFFANDILSEKANKIIIEKTLFIKDSIDFYNIKTNSEINGNLRFESIDIYLKFIEGCSTTSFKDSASKLLIPLIEKITEDNIEWKWNSEDKTEAVKLIFFKIEYNPHNLNISWYREHLTFYCLNIGQADLKEKALLSLDKLALSNTSKDELLDLYLSKGFLFWSLGKNEQAIDVFKSKINETYQNKEDLTFKKNIKISYHAFHKQGILFPDEKNMWKKIKKLKYS